MTLENYFREKKKADCRFLPRWLTRKVISIILFACNYVAGGKSSHILEGQMAPYVTVRSVLGERFTQEIESGNHRLFSDRQISVGGSDRGPGPYGYLLAALGS